MVTNDNEVREAGDIVNEVLCTVAEGLNVEELLISVKYNKKTSKYDVNMVYTKKRNKDE